MAKRKKFEYVPINSLGDMVELVNDNVEVFDRQLLKLTKRSRGLAALSVAAISYAVYAIVQCRKQDEELYRLSVRVKKLENKEGE